MNQSSKIFLIVCSTLFCLLGLTACQQTFSITDQEYKQYKNQLTENSSKTCLASFNKQLKKKNIILQEWSKYCTKYTICILRNVDRDSLEKYLGKLTEKLESLSAGELVTSSLDSVGGYQTLIDCSLSSLDKKMKKKLGVNNLPINLN
jgi:hypothetical protein